MYEFLIQLSLEEAKKHRENPSAYQQELYESYHLFPLGEANFGQGYNNINHMAYPNYAMALALAAFTANLQHRLLTDVVGTRACKLYIWTSLALLGTVLPGKTFKAKGWGFDNQIGYIFTFSSNSLHEEFEKTLNQSRIKGYLDSITLTQKQRQEEAEGRPFINYQRYGKNDKECRLGLSKGDGKDKHIIFKSFKKLFGSIPSDTTHLTINISACKEINDPLEITDLFSFIPHHVTHVSCYRGNNTALTLFYSSLPSHIVGITANLKPSELPNRNERGVLPLLFQAFPRWLSHLDLSSSTLGEISPEVLIESFNLLPPALISLKLKDNCLNNYAHQDLERVLAKLPASLIELDLSENGIDDFIGILPPSVQRIFIKNGVLLTGQQIAEKLAKKNAECEAQRKAVILGKSKQLLAEISKIDVTTAIIEHLLSEGADINYQDETIGYTVLMTAIDASNERVAEYLVNSGANLLLTNKKGKTAADLASKSSAVYQLIQEKINHNSLSRTETRSSENQHSILLQQYVVTFEAKAKRIDEFFELGADINYQNSDGDTALMLVVDVQQERITEYLLKNNANPFLKNRFNRTARDLVPRASALYELLKGYELLFATRSCDLVTIKALLKADRNIINFQGADGYSPLLIAVEKNIPEIASLLLSYDPNFDLCLDNGKGVMDLATGNVMENVLHEHGLSPPAIFQPHPGGSIYGFFGTSEAIDENNIIDTTTPGYTT